MRHGKIVSGEDAVIVDLPVDVAAGVHGVLALVAGRTGALERVSRS
jgi:hypothetical protein